MLLLASLCLTSIAIAEVDEPSFGNDVSIGYGIGQAWADTLSGHRYGNIVFRYDAFVRDRTTSGPRMGLGLWGAMTVGPKLEVEQTELDGRKMRQSIPMNHTGILALLRFDPESPMSGTFGMGFGRLGIEDMVEGSVALPALTIEAGGRHKTAGHGFMDWMLRTHWATRNEPISGELEDWWLLELNVSMGVRLR